MSLGLTRDSVLDLASLANHKTEDDSEIETANSSKSSESPSDSPPNSLRNEMSVDVKRVDSPDSTELDLPSPDETPPPSITYGNYAGFAVDYAEYENAQMTYDVDPYAPTVFGQRPNQNIWCCLFPWAAKPIEDDFEKRVERREPIQRPNYVSNLKITNSEDTDDVSTGSEAYGEKLTDKEQKAVLARLRLIQPDPPSQMSPPELKSTHREEKKEVDDVIDQEAERNSPKGILKTRSNSSLPNTAAALAQKKLQDGDRRRSLFPQYQEKPKRLTSDDHVSFAPMARVVTVKARGDMSIQEKSSVWWQRKDYDDFKKTGRIIAKAMLEGGSEVWLATNKSWQTLPTYSSPQIQRRAFHLSDHDQIQSSVPGEMVMSEETGNKWWCKFGHSRRGLEHIASLDEGRQRQTNVRSAIRMVVDEQRRQKIYRKEDSEKLRMISLQYTSWARDLALAAASADTEAVKSNFSTGAKSREFYLLKQARADLNKNSTPNTPAFMSVPTSVMSMHHLDANTASQVRFRRKQVAPLRPSQPEIPTNTMKPREEAIHDSTGATIAKQAAGYGINNTDMAAVLSGMGAVEESATVVAH